MCKKNAPHCAGEDYPLDGRNVVVVVFRCITLHFVYCVIAACY